MKSHPRTKPRTASAEQIEWHRTDDGETFVNDVVSASAWLDPNGTPLRLRLCILNSENDRWELLFRRVEDQWVATDHDGDWRIALNASKEFRVLPNGEVSVRGRYAEVGGAERDREQGEFEVYATAKIERVSDGV